MGPGIARMAVKGLALGVTLCALLLLPPAALGASWTAMTGPTSSIQQIDRVRGVDGALHVVWARDTPGSGVPTNDILHAPISSSRAVGTPVAIASGFSSAENPAIVSLPDGTLEVFFGGIQCTAPSCPQGLFTSTSTDGGATWTAPATISNLDESFGSAMNAAVLSDGTPFQTWSHTTGVTVHRGLDPRSPDYDFQAGLGAGCCGYYSNFAADTAGHLQLAWDSNATGHLGVLSQAVDPATGAPSGTALLMPGSVTSYAGAPAHVQMLSRTPIVALPGQAGQFYVAYPAGYPQTSKVLLWRVGSAGPVTVVDKAADHNAVSLAADASGRLWVFWSGPAASGPHVFAERLTATAAEPAIDLGAPSGAQSIYALDGDVTPSGDPEVLALTGSTDGSSGTWFARGPQTAPVPAPVLGKSFSVQPISGTVLVKVPGAGGSSSGYGGAAAGAALTKGTGFVPLTQARSVPAGSVIDARRGTLKLITAAAQRGKTQEGVFRLGLFKLSQTKSGVQKGLATLSLVEGAFAGAPSYASCKAAGAAADGSPRAHAALSRRILQTLRARAHGRFRTRGRFSAGTVRGTEWGTRDRCDGTLTIVRRGTVMVRDFGRRKTIAVHAGHRYLAKAIRRRHR